MVTTVKHMQGRKLRIQIETASGSGIFAEKCMINTSRGIAFASSVDEQPIPFCDNDEDLPSWLERSIDGLNYTVNGAGIFDSPSLNFFWEWYRTGESKNVRISVDVDGADGGGYWESAAVLSTFDVTGATQKQRAEFTGTILSDGVVDWVDAT